MSVKKTVLFASMAIAMLAFALPAVASAGNLKDLATGSTVAANESVEFSGVAEFESLGTGIRCTVDATLKADSASELHVTTFNITTTTCAGFGTTFKGCKVQSDSLFNMNWRVDVNALDFDITNVKISAGLKECTNSALTSNTVEFAAVTAKPMNTAGTTAAVNEGIAGVELSGSGTATTNTGLDLSVGAKGTLNVSGTDSPKCTYAFE